MRKGWVAKIVVLLLFPFYSLWIGWSQGIDLFVAFGSLYAFVQAIPKWILRKPMVTFVRGDSSIGMIMQNSPKLLLRMNKVIEHLGLAFSDRIVTVNTATYEKIGRIMKGKKNVEVKLLFNNIPLRGNIAKEGYDKTKTRFGIPEGSKVLVTAGIINRGKNIESLIRCLSRIGMDNLFLLVVGEGFTRADLGYENYLKDLTSALGLTEKVIFTGWLEKREVLEIFQAADLFILPSTQEGMPNVILEAMATDLLCIGSNIPGIKDILHHEELMFEPTDEDAMVKKVHQLFSNKIFFNEAKRLFQDREKDFFFDWKEKVFEMIARGIPSTTIS
jgi:glycosyltransferase involved in cell wall biosynthesis